MASVERVEDDATAAQDDGLLFNPRTYDGAGLDPESRRIMLATIDFFESRGKATLKEHDHERRWYSDFLEFVARERVFATLLTPAAEANGDADKRWDTARICALQRDHRLLRPPLLVHLAGLDPRPGADLAERQRRGQAARRHAARRRLDLRLRPLRAGARRRHLLDRHGPHPRRRRLQRQRRQVLHRQREQGGHGVGLRPPRRHRRARGLRLLRRRQPAPQLQADQERRQLAVVRQQLRARGLPGAGRGRPAHRPRGLRRRAEHRQRRQVQPRLRLHRDLRARLLRGDHPRRRARPVRHAGHRLPARPPGVRRRLRPPGRDEAVRRPRDRLHALRQPRGPPLPALQPDHQDEGDDRGRARDRPDLGRGRRQGVREGHVLRDGRARHPRAAEARGHGPREHGAGPEVHGRLPVRPGRVRRRAQARRRRRRRVPLPPGPGPRARARSASTTGAPSTRTSPTSRTSPASPSRPTR